MPTTPSCRVSPKGRLMTVTVEVFEELHRPDNAAEEGKDSPDARAGKTGEDGGRTVTPPAFVVEKN